MKKDSVRIRICLSYDGAPFFGWQKQPNFDQTIQGILEDKLTQVSKTQVSVVGSGRTDRGVHALNQWAHFDLPEGSVDLGNLKYTLNRMTPESLWVKSVEIAPKEFHAQISAESKCYLYRVLPGPEQSPFHQAQSWVVGRDLNLESLQNMAKKLLGEHDFSSFQSQGTPVSSPVRKILQSRWVTRKSGILEYRIQGTGFLKQMVRNLVGTMLKIEQLQEPSERMSEILEACNRGLAAAPAPPQGLFLASVQYPKNLDNKCRKL